MLSNVSWVDYLLVVGGLVIIYYILIGAFFMRTDFQSVFKGKLKNSRARRSGGDETVEELEQIVDDIKYAILEGAGKEARKQDLLDQISARLANYSGLRKPAFRVALNNQLISESKNICGVVFSEDELNSVWETLPR